MTSFLFGWFLVCCAMVGAGFFFEAGRLAMLGCAGMVLLLVLIEWLEERRVRRR